MTSSINFDADQHIYYRDDGIIVPNVTGVLEDVGIIKTQWFTDQACIRGTYVHQVTALWDEGYLVEKTLDPILVPYLAAYKRFRKETGFKPQLIENIVYSRPWNYAGALDRGGDWPSQGKTLLDIKSGYAPKWAALQIAAYDKAEPQPFDVFVTLQLRDNGTYSLHYHENIEDAWMQFLYALKTYHYKHQEVQYYAKKESESN